MLKTMCEAVVEGMGSIVDKHASAKRGLSQQAMVEESYIEWNGPLRHEAKSLLIEALDYYFTKENGSKT